MRACFIHLHSFIIRVPFLAAYLAVSVCLCVCLVVSVSDRYSDTLLHSTPLHSAPLCSYLLSGKANGMCIALRVGKTYQLAETFVASTRSRGKIPKKMHLKGRGWQTICLKIYRLVLFACCLVFSSSGIL